MTTRIAMRFNPDKDCWEVILKPGRKARPGAKFSFGNGILKAEVLKIVEEGNRIVRFSYDGIFEEILDRLGQMPLPPYITEKLEDKDRYHRLFPNQNLPMQTDRF